MTNRSNRYFHRYKVKQYLKKMNKPTIGYLWGQSYQFTPGIVSEYTGDGLQIIWVKSTDSRPAFWLVCIDSSIDVESDDFRRHDYDEALLQPIENRFGNRHDYEEKIDPESDTYIYHHYGDKEDIKTEDEMGFPMLSWGGGLWGVEKNFGKK